MSACDCDKENVGMLGTSNKEQIMGASVSKYERARGCEGVVEKRE